MGLDITAHETIRFVHAEGDHEKCDQLDGDFCMHVRVWLAHEDWADRIEGVEVGSYESVGERFRFRAGSYGGYNLWRDWLARTFLDAESAREVWENEDRFRGKPFFEMISFTDCDGVLAGKVLGKLRDDYEAHSPPAPRDGVPEDTYYAEKYEEWKQAFRLAAPDGCVVFH